MYKTLVVPSCREGCFRRFLDEWGDRGGWDNMILIEDGPKKTFDVNSNIFHYAWKDIGFILGDNSFIISRQDSAIRSFGFLMACHLGADVILTLDDDCYPHGDSPVFDGHMESLNSHNKWICSVPGMRTRGLPYCNLGSLDNVMVNVGLWSGVPDLDSIQTLSGQYPADGFDPPAGSRIIPKGQYIPMCAMNLAFRREVAPLMYFPPMGEGQRYSRFDDIWSGVIVKKCLDHLGMSMSVGSPFVRHVRASDPMVNLVKEAPGIAANESFWETVDAIQLTASTPAECMTEMGRSFVQHKDNYISILGNSMMTWIKLWNKLVP